MKTQQRNPAAQPLSGGLTVNPELDGKYENDPVVLKKAAEAKALLHKYGLPDDEVRARLKKGEDA